MTNRTLTNIELQEKYQPIYNPDDEFRLVVTKREVYFDNYRINEKGLITSKLRPKGLKLGVFRPSTTSKRSYPRVKLSGGINKRGEKFTLNLMVSNIVAFTFLDKMSWDALPSDLMEGWADYPKVVQDALLYEAFDVDHIDGNTWNSNVKNLQFMLPSHNVQKSNIGNKGGALNTGKNHWLKKVIYKDRAGGAAVPCMVNGVKYNSRKMAYEKLGLSYYSFTTKVKKGEIEVVDL